MKDVAEGLSAEDADRLSRSGESILDGKSNRVQIAFLNEVDAVVERVRKEFGLTYYGAVGVLQTIAHNLMHEAQYEGCDGCDE
ncbi:hypothetical protein LCGC14_2349170 [marine sediment metagenome]|uniref:Uncharacterized protein n=1 Tax=marine sediment metagenome TaxID=412755 RepID=A0A0F9CAG4_9ZZZZ